MHLHLGGEVVVRTDDVVGIFDIESSTTSKDTRDYLAICEKNLIVTNVTPELPKSFVITSNDDGIRVYITQISCATLKLRSLSKGAGL